MYAELVYFDGAHFAHIAAYFEHLRLRRARACLGGRLDRSRFERARAA